MRISVSKAKRSFSATPDQSVLDAALDAGLNLAHSCKSGACGACRARLLTGEVDYPNGPPLGLTAAEVSEGLILLCQAHARTDLSLELFDVSSADQALIKRLPCRIDRVEQWSHDVMGVFVRLPAAERFDFLPGQYIDFLLPGGRRRSFSIASPPHDSRLLELHVRRVSGGEFTEPLFSRAGARHVAHDARTLRAFRVSIARGAIPRRSTDAAARRRYRSRTLEEHPAARDRERLAAAR